MEEVDRSSELLHIVDLLHTTKKKQWHLILKKLTRIFDAEEAFFVELDKDHVVCSLSSRNIIKHYKKIGHDPVALLTIKNRSTVQLANYSSSSIASSYWIKRGLKSILSVPVWYGDELFGALQLATFKHTRTFKDEEIELIEKISKVISLAMRLERDRERHGKTLAIEISQMQFIYENKIPTGYKNEEFSQWIERYINRLLRTTQAQVAAFIMPQEEIYIAISRYKPETNLISYSVDDRVEDLVIYKLFKRNIREILLLDDLEERNIGKSEFAKRNNVHSAIFLPVVINNKTMAIFSLGFKEKHKLTKSHRIFLHTVAVYLMFAIETCKNLHSVNSLLSEMEERFIESFVLMMEARDVYTKGHSQRVAIYARNIAKAMGLSKQDQIGIYTAGILHDIGKMGIPDAILLKPRKLSDEEYRIMQYHPEFSYQIIKNIERFKDIAYLVRYHHERCDGSGYPEGLKCSEIPLGAKILAIADVFDAVTTDRPYRKALSPDDAIELLTSNEHLFDKEITSKAIEPLKEAFKSREVTEEAYRRFMPEKVDRMRMEIFTRDFMTGLLSMRSFVEKLGTKISQQIPFSVFRVDIKDLSLINHRYSMEVGDKFITYTAQALRQLEDTEAIARTQADVFYFIYNGKMQNTEFAHLAKEHLKSYVVEKLAETELDLKTWEKMVDFYVTFSEYAPGKLPEDMMYECQQYKKEIKAIAEGKDVTEHHNGLF